MKLVHYGADSIPKLEKKPYHHEYDWIDWITRKPVGLWVSVEDEDSVMSWKQWCESEEFRLSHLAFAYRVILKESANILYLRTCEEIFAFSEKYCIQGINNPFVTKTSLDTYYIDWQKVYELYQGIIITPYQWDCRMDSRCNWYYSWDCASGCIWDIECIEEFSYEKCHV